MNLVDINTDKMRDAMIKINANIAELEVKIIDPVIINTYVASNMWNMQTTASFNVNYTIPEGKILVGYSALVIPNDGDMQSNETLGDLEPALLFMQINYSFSNNRFELSRSTGGDYNSANYNGAIIVIRPYLSEES